MTKVVITASVEMELAEELNRTGKPSYHVNLALKRYFNHLDRKKRKKERLAGPPQEDETTCP